DAVRRSRECTDRERQLPHDATRSTRATLAHRALPCAGAGRSDRCRIASHAIGVRVPRKPVVPRDNGVRRPMSDIRLPYELITLDNGLRVIVHEDRRTPLVCVNVWYHVGSKEEVPGRTGFAHLFEHL